MVQPSSTTEIVERFDGKGNPSELPRLSWLVLRLGDSREINGSFFGLTLDFDGRFGRLFIDANNGSGDG
jgi:hypothetical protein